MVHWISYGLDEPGRNDLPAALPGQQRPHHDLGDLGGTV